MSLSSLSPTAAEDLEIYLAEKEVFSYKELSAKIGTRESNEDIWETIGTYITAYILGILEVDVIGEVILDTELGQEILEILDGNNKLSKNSNDYILYVDFSVDSEKIKKLTKEYSGRALYIVSVFAPGKKYDSKPGNISYILSQ